MKDTTRWYVLEDLVIKTTDEVTEEEKTVVRQFIKSLKENGEDEPFDLSRASLAV